MQEQKFCCHFVAKQRERLRFSGVEAASDPKAIGLSPLLHEKGVFGIDYVCKLLKNMNHWIIRRL